MQGTEAAVVSDRLCFQTRALTKVYGSGHSAVHALRGVDLDLPERELVVLLGASGSGKSTLLNILGGLDRPTSGQLWFRGDELTGASQRELTQYRRRHVGFVFQFYNLMASLTARENVALVTEIAENPLSPDEALAIVGLEERRENAGQAVIDVLVALEERRLEGAEIQAIVEDRPQHLVREAQVVVVVLAPGQRHGDGAYVVRLGDMEADIGILVDNLAVPAEPDAAAHLQRLAERRGEPTRLDALVEVGDPVRRDYETSRTHSIASHGFDSRMAPLMMPTIE